MTPQELRDIRARLAETQTSLGRRLGVAMRTVQDWEGGKRRIPEMAVRLLAKLRRKGLL